MTNGACYFAEQAPAGAHPVAPNLQNTDSVYVDHRNADSAYVIHRNADSVYVIHRSKDSVHVIHRHTNSVCAIHRKFNFRHVQCVHVRHIHSVCTTYKVCICNTEFASLKHTVYNIYL